MAYALEAAAPQWRVTAMQTMPLTCRQEDQLQDLSTSWGVEPSVGAAGFSLPQHPPQKQNTWLQHKL